MKKIPYGYDVLWYRVVDGDTIHLKVEKEVKHTIDFGFKIKRTTIDVDTFEDNFRLEGINTPEIRGKERPEGLISKDYLKSLLPPIIEYEDGREKIHSGFLYAATHKQGKYGRYLVTLYLQHVGFEEEDVFIENLNYKLVYEGYAELYDKDTPIKDPLHIGLFSPGYIDDFIAAAESDSRIK